MSAATSSSVTWIACLLVLTGCLLVSPGSTPQAQQAIPDSIAAPNTRPVMTVHAAGAQIYECTPVADGRRGWRFREPIAALFVNGVTAGRHFAGPSWQLTDGALIVARAAASAPGATGEDVPWLKLAVVEGRASGQLAAVTVIQRINTRGGTLTGPCDTVGALRPVPYSSDYVFLAPSR
ncbi:DUF3455 domain-containing protein [Paracraurococcus lichenis]|uniref:DUF3455 domain-containing protein n=1 Tax=Paracraurococcus lichenis TaxID=3064888 RepID=A0ABT9EDW3_9PROT|nr:DUF3455 domain-containing protein [Paracraurococcus sp. LOR1-02]MDO9714414.1 DUF3455 domain-containing protein [Paracraurococcus sp. LOR1-02]